MADSGIARNGAPRSIAVVPVVEPWPRRATLNFSTCRANKDPDFASENVKLMLHTIVNIEWGLSGKCVGTLTFGTDVWKARPLCTLPHET